MRGAKLLAALAVGLVLAACATPGPGPVPDELAGSRWQFVEFESSDDAIGVRRPENPEDYVMELQADGNVAMQLNCNRATGTWSADDNGTFTFGPLGVTRALCPPPSMDEEIARHTEHVRTYVMRDGRLYLNLMADGGNLVWERLAEFR